MRTRSPLLLLALVCLCLGACRLPSRTVSRLTPGSGTPAPVAQVRGTPLATPPPCTAAAPGRPPARGSRLATISTAYHALLQDFVRPLQPAPLLQAAWEGATAEAQRQGVSFSVAAPQFGGASDDDWRSFASAYAALSAATEGRVDQVQLAFAAVARMAASVNEGHTYFVDPQTYAQEGKERQFSGIGVMLTGATAPFIVEDVFQDGPAARAGLKPGDMIVAVDGCDARFLSSAQLGARVRGPAGTTVQITVDRPERGQLEVGITRALITIPALHASALPNKTGLVQLHSFPASTTRLSDGKTIGAELDSVLHGFADAGDRGWILDLRGDPGGQVDGLQAIAGRILPPGNFFSFQGRSGQRIEERTNGNRITTPPLLAVLIDSHTASAAEILASAIQEEGIAPIVGERSAGVANGAQVVSIGDGAGLSITHWQTYTVQNHAINGQGVTPTITVTRSAQDLAEGADPQLQRALQLGAHS